VLELNLQKHFNALSNNLEEKLGQQVHTIAIPSSVET